MHQCMHGAELLEWLARLVWAVAETRIWLFVHWMYLVSVQLSRVAVHSVSTHIDERCCVTDDRPNLSAGRHTVRRQPQHGELMTLF